MIPSSRFRSSAQSGFTLVELMVALGLSMLLGVALIKMQAAMSKQTMVTSDVGVRDTQSRAAADLLTQDLSSAGFLFGNGEAHCTALMSYNTAGYFIGHRVDAVPASTTATLPFAPSLTLNYPSGNEANVASDVLVIQTNTSAALFSDTNNPIIKTIPSTTLFPMTTGVLPVQSTAGLTLSDAAVVQTPMTNNKMLCMRVPIKLVTTDTSITSSLTATMPGNFYTGFAAKTAAAGFAGTLTNANLYQSHVTDIGAIAGPGQNVVYYIQSTGTPALPTLMRAAYSAVNDSLIANSQQAIAVGVIALQVRFGVDSGSGTVSYFTAAQVTTNQTWDSVVSTRVALISRTITPNADNATSATSIPVSAPFGSVFTVPYAGYRFYDTETEIFSRNKSWN